MTTSHLRLSVPKSLTLHSVYLGVCANLPLLLEEASDLSPSLVWPLGIRGKHCFCGPVGVTKERQKWSMGSWVVSIHISAMVKDAEYFSSTSGHAFSSFEGFLFSSQDTHAGQKAAARLSSLILPYGSPGWNSGHWKDGKHHCLLSYLAGLGNDVFIVKCLLVKRMGKKLLARRPSPRKFIGYYKRWHSSSGTECNIMPQ